MLYVILLLILMPFIYLHIFTTLDCQQRLYEAREKESILNVQVQSLRSRIDEFSASTALFKEERHNFRHQMRTVVALAEKGQFDELQAMAIEYAGAMPEKMVDSYCEHAIHACQQIDPAGRFIELKAITAPTFMLQIRNSFDGVVAFDEEGIPLSGRKGHSFGTRSIVTFCEKNNAFCEFGTEGSVSTCG